MVWNVLLIPPLPVNIGRVFLASEFENTYESIKQVESRLTLIEKLDKIEHCVQLQGVVGKLKQDVLILDKISSALEKGFCMMEEDFDDVNKDLDIVQSVTENVDNLQRRNNIHIRGIKEYAEGKDLVGVF